MTNLNASNSEGVAICNAVRIICLESLQFNKYDNWHIGYSFAPFKTTDFSTLN